MSSIDSSQPAASTMLTPTTTRDRVQYGHATCDSRGIFPFLKLPAEIRLLVYDQIRPVAVTSEVVFLPVRQPIRHLNSGSSADSKPERQTSYPPPFAVRYQCYNDNPRPKSAYGRAPRPPASRAQKPSSELLTLLLSCRLINQEFTAELYKKMQFTLESTRPHGDEDDVLLQAASFVHTQRAHIILPNVYEDEKSVVKRLKPFVMRSTGLSSLSISLVQYAERKWRGEMQPQRLRLEATLAQCATSVVEESQRTGYRRRTLDITPLKTFQMDIDKFRVHTVDVLAGSTISSGQDTQS